jgi:hypothetical protein
MIFIFFYFLFWHYFDIFFESTFSFFLCNKCNVVISKIHYKSTIFLKFIQKNYMIPIKMYDNKNNLKMLILNMVLNFTFVCNPKNYKCDNLNNPPIHAFTQSFKSIESHLSCKMASFFNLKLFNKLKFPFSNHLARHCFKQFVSNTNIKFSPHVDKHSPLRTWIQVLLGFHLFHKQN